MPHESSQDREVVTFLTARWRRGETTLLIKAKSKEAILAAIEAAKQARFEIEGYVLRYPEFRYSLHPLKIRDPEKPKVVSLMLRAAEIAGVGPFAAVAGAIAQVASVAASEVGGAIVENGGDISASGKFDFSVGIFAGDSPLSGTIGFRITSGDLPIGICTSSGTVGHSISFGVADAVVVVADEASVADAAATAIANEVTGEDIEQSIKNGLEKADEIDEIRGCLIIRGKMAGMKGKLPKLIPTERKSVLKEIDWV
ncbi:MAG: UPF0280 family protein [Candidatus Hadarchaeales archaeon]